jgi:hypothetical protein
MIALLRRAKQLAFYAAAANPQVVQQALLILGLGIMGLGASQLVSKASHALSDLSRSVYTVERKLEWQTEAIEALRREIRERDNAPGG